MTQGKSDMKNSIVPIPEKILLSEYYANKHDAYNSMMEAFDSRVENDDFNQEALATLLDVNKGVISRRINGSANITLKTLSNMATALKCRLNINFQRYEDLPKKNYNSPYENLNARFAKNTKAAVQWNSPETIN